MKRVLVLSSGMLPDILGIHWSREKITEKLEYRKASREESGETGVLEFARYVGGETPTRDRQGVRSYRKETCPTEYRSGETGNEYTQKESLRVTPVDKF